MHLCRVQVLVDERRQAGKVRVLAVDHLVDAHLDNVVRRRPGGLGGRRRGTAARLVGVGRAVARGQRAPEVEAHAMHRVALLRPHHVLVHLRLLPYMRVGGGVCGGLDTPPRFRITLARLSASAKF